MKRSTPVVSKSRPSTSPSVQSRTFSSLAAGCDTSADTPTPRTLRFHAARRLPSPRMIGCRRPPHQGGGPAPTTVLAGLLLAALTLAIPPSTTAAATTETRALPALAGDPAALVRPLDGTGTGPVSPGTVGEFPGADTPFGMIQWSPDTAPNAVQSGGGYDDTDSHINGF